MGGLWPGSTDTHTHVHLQRVKYTHIIVFVPCAFLHGKSIIIIVIIHCCYIGDPDMPNSSVNTDSVVGPVHAVRVELPMFDPLDIDTWLTMCDNLMLDAGLSIQSTMFRKVLAKLPPAHFKLVKDLATQSPLDSNCYTNLKSRLRSRLQLTPNERFQRFERLPRELGCRKPTELYADLLSLYPNDMAHEIIHEAFLSRIPATLQLLCREWLLTVPLSEVALRADQHCSPAQVSSVELPAVAEAADTASNEERVAAVRQYTGRRPRVSRQSSSSRTDGGSSPQTAFIDRWCRLHQRYGPMARRCLGQCSFSSDMPGNSSGSRQ